jgi:DNA-binding NtrC family response regulator
MHMVNTLEQAGYQVRQARCGAEAMHIIAFHSPPIAALVTDVEMPGEMDGCGLAWRAAATSSRIALIVVSGKGTIEVGCLPPNTLFLPKPVDRTHLLNAMRTRICREGSRRIGQG